MLAKTHVVLRKAVMCIKFDGSDFNSQMGVKTVSLYVQSSDGR